MRLGVFSMTKKILYFDMDGVLVDYPSGFAQFSPETLKQYEGRLHEVPDVCMRCADPTFHIDF
jgi:beta-phosphoglucomutase-like phosphatase (HAD superfamily)